MIKKNDEVLQRVGRTQMFKKIYNQDYAYIYSSRWKLEHKPCSLEPPSCTDVNQIATNEWSRLIMPIGPVVVVVKLITLSGPVKWCC